MEPVKKPANRPPRSEFEFLLLRQAKLLTLKTSEGNIEGALYIARYILSEVEKWAAKRRENGTSNTRSLE